MAFSTVFTLASLLSLTSAHFKVLNPQWRGDSLTLPDASQWTFPCANVSETPANNRTLWPLTGGSVRINGTHEWALTYVNLGLGTNVSAFNISLVDGFNQTGAGIFCLKEAGKAALEEGFKTAGLSMEDVEGMQASVQIIQISHSGASLYNCADITFNATAALLSDDECANSTGVSGVAIQNADTPSTTGEPASTESKGAATVLKPAIRSGMLAALLAWGLL
ncbi:hypothetical protein BDV95DRAFT_575348 [Massariosphaeria phaeospora]|uniref:Copper acquisition factor BIM1-like domain-containing protein n=1 Tax=Massariosphaeria phaeospora TaxID=100035 RepID=A0A7C8M7Z7_9PLEO|nr:hypothetical protein BDV95DRAFT_575348 [Massariosphaeria phaeospora]